MVSAGLREEDKGGGGVRVPLQLPHLKRSSQAGAPLRPPLALTMPGLGSAPRRPVLLLLLLLLLVVPGRPGGREGA